TYISSFLVLPRLPCSTCFPYTTLFRSFSTGRFNRCRTFNSFFIGSTLISGEYSSSSLCLVSGTKTTFVVGSGVWLVLLTFKYPRSEEHTSELQSRENLVCRLLLEKKNK